MCLSNLYFIWISLPTSDGVAPEVNSPVVPFLTMRLPEYVTVDDPSLDVLNLLRIVHSLNRYWGFLYNIIVVYIAATGSSAYFDWNVMGILFFFVCMFVFRCHSNLFCFFF